ncbi:GAF domain-containing protein [Viridibacillus sp. YIM B01967]|uniref:GAF domain-containing protein n=1 Tax=Viridibacillus soli TaxID=2798301 RepID=A0ABS1H2I3_9BACL|nr:GAF domain-containing protein [Viridibacillus soli]MBK3493601.1 GAF domain-containing protein [Viridibacillus soli]
MFTQPTYNGNTIDQYALLAKQLDALLEDETDNIANLSNASALLNQFLHTINWCGFYLYKNEELLLGPFQGLPACVHIAMGRGVCGTAAANQETLVVANVHQFPGHIACDAASQSEIVVPIIIEGNLFGVLDIDSPINNRFSTDDREGIEQFVHVLTKHLSL